MSRNTFNKHNINQSPNHINHNNHNNHNSHNNHSNHGNHNNHNGHNTHNNNMNINTNMNHNNNNIHNNNMKKKPLKALPPKRMNSNSNVSPSYMTSDSQSFFPMGFQQHEGQGNYTENNYMNNAYPNAYPGSPTKINSNSLNIKRKI